MENNLYDYDFYEEPTVAWVPPQQQVAQGKPKEEPFYEYPGSYAPDERASGGEQRREAAPRRQQAGAKPARMSKAETLEVADALKKFLIVASIIGFGALSGLAASHVTGVTSSHAAPSSTAPSFNGPQSPENDDNSGGFFNQGNPNNQGNQGGYQFGSGNSQSPFTGSRSS
jgi:hypothetical protein